jgi:hypothetical protein
VDDYDEWGIWMTVESTGKKPVKKTCFICQHVGWHGWKWAPTTWILDWHLKRTTGK